MTNEPRIRLEDVREAEAAARAIQLVDGNAAAAAEIERLRRDLETLSRRLQIAEATASALAGRKSVRLAEAVQERRRGAIGRLHGRGPLPVGQRPEVQRSEVARSEQETSRRRRPLFSVVMPVYNNGSTLLEALESVRQQTSPDWEVILWDDGSTDPETIEVFDSIEHLNVRKHRAANQGVVGARNSALEHARGEFTIFLDPDDTIERTYLEKAFIAFRRNPDADLVIPVTRVSGTEGQHLWQPPPFDEHVLSYENMAPVATAFRTSIWRLVGGMSAELDGGFEDWGFWRALAEQGCRAVTLPEPLFRYTHSHETGRDAAARASRDELELRIKQLFPSVRGEPRGGVLRSLAGELDRRAFHVGTQGRKPLIVFLPWMLRGGGAENFLLSAIPALQDEFVVTVIATQPVPPGFDDCKDSFLDVTPYVYDLSILAGEEDYPEIVRSIMMRFVNPTILVLGSSWAYSNLAQIRSWVRGAPYVVDLLFNHVGHVGRLLAQQEHVDKVLVAHKRLRSLLVDYFEVSPTVEVLHIAPPPRSDAAEAERGHAPSRTGRLRVGWLGRNSPEKRVDLALAIASASPELELYLAGAGLDTLGRLGGLPQNVHIVGWIDDPLELTRSCDVLLNTSDTEGISLSAMEAMSLGIPVATRAVGGMDELVNDGINGFVYDADNITDLVSRLRDRDLFEQVAAEVEASRLPYQFGYSHMLATLRAALVPDNEP